MSGVRSGNAYGFYCIYWTSVKADYTSRYSIMHDPTLAGLGVVPLY